jgi:hypothetical protein|tara:strand:+ start:39 stop:563 length:525 start_codon:yes stop_codon:yes gene_type:complete
MAIVDMRGEVAKGKATTTGMINEKPNKVTPPNLSGMNKLFDKPKQNIQPQEQATPIDDSLISKVQNLTDQDKATLKLVLSPSVSNVLKKVAPELSPLVEAAGSTEENVIIPVSMFKNFALKRYSGDESQAINNFVADLSNMKMDQQTVPPDMEMPQQAETGQDFESIDSDIQTV